jgi:5-dehydro-2-deoxygluconokinase
MTQKTFDLITMGRSSIDLYSNDIGAPFDEITTFGAFVGGCPTNVAVGASRLGLKTALLTAVGEDPVGDFVLNFLRKESIDVNALPRKAGKRTSAVILGIEPPDKFPLVYYRDNCADIELTIDDVEHARVGNARALLVSGTGLSSEPSRSATIFAMEEARANGTTVFLDFDFRADQWNKPPVSDVRAYGVTLRSIMHLVDIAIATEEEIKAAIVRDASQVSVRHSQISAPSVQGDLQDAIEQITRSGPEALILKRGADGSSIYLRDGAVLDALPFAIDVVNVLGAGDAFASGFIYGYLNGWDWKKSATMGNATGAIVVTRQGCANFMPYANEVFEFVESRGGFERQKQSCPS